MNIETCFCVGGVGISHDIQALGANPHIIIGTPGRMVSLIIGGYLQTGHLKVMALDEAHEIFSRGFKEQAFQVLKHVCPGSQLLVAAPTLSNDIVEMTNQFMQDPILVPNAEE
jgi:ATP-dependent RNA helicase